MGRAVDVLAPLGVVVLAAAGIASRNGVNLPGGETPYLVAGLVLILAHLLLRWERVVKAIGGRQLRYGGNTLVLSLVVLAILVAVNYIAARRPLKKDFTKGQRHSLSDQTKKVVAGLKEDIRILYFERAVNLGAGGADRVKALEGLSPRVKVEFIDPVVKPGLAREYEVRTVPTIVVDRGGRKQKVSNDSEQDLVNALIKVTRDGKKTVCFVEGEGERDIDDSSETGLSGAKSALEAAEYQTRKVLLVREGNVPADCTVLVVGGPRKDLLPAVADAVRRYVRSGGKALIMVEPEFTEAYPNLDGLLREWNLEPGDDLVLDVSLESQMAATGPESPLAARFPYHEITKDFRLATLFHQARSMKAGSGSAEGVVAQNLVETSEESWAEADFKVKGTMSFDAARDQKGPVSLGAVATLQVTDAAPVAAPSSPLPVAGASPVPTTSPAAAPPSPAASGEDEAEQQKPRREARIVAFGDSDFATNGYLRVPGNSDLFQNAVSWLAEDADLISIRPREPDDQRLFLTLDQQRIVALLALVVLPGIFVALGVWSWWQRR